MSTFECPIRQNKIQPKSRNKTVRDHKPYSTFDPENYRGWVATDFVGKFLNDKPLLMDKTMN